MGPSLRSGDDLGVAEHPAPNVEPGDVIMLRTDERRSSQPGSRPAAGRWLPYWRFAPEGVYIEEVSSGSRPIQAVGTAVAAFVGLYPGKP